MDFRDTHDKHRRGRLVVPGRDNPPRRQIVTPPTPEKSSDLSHEDDGSFFGIPDTAKDDISTDVSFKEILSAWMKQTIKHSPLEKRVQQAGQQKVVASKNIQKMKKDLKWALQADLDEPVRPKPKPEPKQPPRHSTASHQQLQHATTPQSHVAPHQKSIDINISFDSLPKPNFVKLRTKTEAVWRRLMKLQRRQKLLIVGSIFTIAIAVFAVPFLQSQFGILGGTKKVAGDGVKKPQYETLVPQNLTPSDVTWKRVSPANRDPVFAYADKVNGVSVSVSQQPLPDSFKPNVDESIEKLAKDFAATDKVTTGSTTFYVGTSANGPQSVILEKSNLLILIKSAEKISDDIWKAYIDSLH